LLVAVQMRGVFAHWKEALLPVALVLAVSLGAGIALNGREGAYKESVGSIVGALWLIAPVYIGWRVAAAQGKLAQASAAGVVFGFAGEVLFYALSIAGAAAGLFGVPVNVALVNGWKVAEGVGLQAAIGAVRAGALAALGALAAIFGAKMKEAE